MADSFKILVVDDCEAFRRFICLTLQERLDFQITEASDGLEAVQKIEEVRPDLIVLDVGLPNLNGLEVARRARKLAPTTRILFISQETSPDIVREALDASALGYVHKLHAKRDLLRAVEAALIGEQFVSDGLIPTMPADHGSLRTRGG